METWDNIAGTAIDTCLGWDLTIICVDLHAFFQLNISMDWIKWCTEVITTIKNMIYEGASSPQIKTMLKVIAVSR